MVKWHFGQKICIWPKAGVNSNIQYKKDDITRAELKRLKNICYYFLSVCLHSTVRMIMILSIHLLMKSSYAAVCWHWDITFSVCHSLYSPSFNLSWRRMVVLLRGRPIPVQPWLRWAIKAIHCPSLLTCP